jgi:hypothetical protein
MHALLNKDQAGASIWVVNLLDATMDHIEGLKWNEIDPTKIKPKGAVVATQKQKEPEPEPDTSTPPQEGPDQTTYDVAIQLVDEYEEIFRQIARATGSDGTDPEDWRALTDKAGFAKASVTEMRQNYEDLQTVVNAAQEELERLTTTVANQLHVHNVAGTLIESTISDMYANVLLDLLKNFEVEKQGNAMLDLIFTRLDKLAGI